MSIGAIYIASTGQPITTANSRKNKIQNPNPIFLKAGKTWGSLKTPKISQKQGFHHFRAGVKMLKFIVVWDVNQSQIRLNSWKGTIGKAGTVSQLSQWASS
jgi:hypothetical protein